MKVPSPHPLILNRPTPLDLSYSGLEEFKQPEVNEYGPRDSSVKPTTGCDKESDNSKENTDDSLKQQQKTDSSSVKSPLKVDKDWKEKLVSMDEDDVEPIPKVEKKTVIPTATKKEFVKPETPVRRSVSCPNVHKHMVPRAVLMKSGLKTVNTTRPINTVRSVNTGRPFSTASDARGRSKPCIYKAQCLETEPHLLSDFKDFDGGYVTFGGGANRGRITGKGKQHRASEDQCPINPITKPLFILLLRYGSLWSTFDETSEILQNFIKEIENLVDKKVKIIRSDNGTELKNKVMDELCREKEDASYLMMLSPDLFADAQYKIQIGLHDEIDDSEKDS
ncbi:putative ribonuclease H-like domain-containing protein [Tanacetum coccineum]